MNIIAEFLRCKKYNLLLSLFLFTNPIAVQAGQQTGKVQSVILSTQVSPYSFVMSGIRVARPACATDDVWDIPTMTSPDNAKAAISGILSAFHAGKQVTVTGRGTCNPDQPNREDVDFILIQ